MNAKAKGNRGERALRDCFRRAGWPNARRTQQYAGNTGDASDVTVPELPWLHLEAKNTEAKNFLDWLDQAFRDTEKNQKIPVVSHKRNGRDWIAMLKLSDLILIIKDGKP